MENAFASTALRSDAAAPLGPPERNHLKSSAEQTKKQFKIILVTYDKGDENESETAKVSPNSSRSVFTENP